MDLALSPQDQAFRDEVRQFVAERLPADIAARVLGLQPLAKDDYVRWQDILAVRGWLAGAWPTQFGGCGWTPLQCHIFDEQTAAHGAPRLIPFGLSMVAPVLMRFGSPWQQDHYLSAIRENRQWWCQGYSEPGAGSDLAALTTRAVRDGDAYVVTGQKTWTTYAQYADMMFCLVRTSEGARRQEGISFLLIDMHSPGVSVRPIRLLDGESEVNEVWFDQVRVPLANRVGEEGKGWTYAKYLLGHERTNIAQIGASKRDLQGLKSRLAGADRDPSGSASLMASRIADLEIDLLALEMTVLRVLAGRASAPGAEASILKIRGTEIQQAIAELGMDLLGEAALFADYSGTLPATARYLNMRKTSIYGGSNEIQRNLVAQHLLGL